MGCPTDLSASFPGSRPPSSHSRPVPWSVFRSAHAGPARWSGPALAYGEYNDEAVQVLPKEQFAGIELTEGMSLYGSGENGETVQVVVKSFTDAEVTIDYNHPMAGRTLMFSVAVLSLREATEEEVQTGVVGGMAAMGGGCCGGGGGGHDHDHGSAGSCGTSAPEPKQSHGGCGCH